MSLAVLATGPLALVQDLGRPGHAAQGVGTSGAADRGAFALGNRLVGNPPTAAALEIVLGGLRLRAQRPVLLALTGAVAPATVDGRPVGHACLLRLATGDMLALSTPPAGLRTYVALRGGVDAPPVLGSRSTDTLSGLGPPPLAAGDTLRLGPPSRPLPDLDSAPVARAGPVALRLLPGPRADWADDPRGPWTVGPDSDRVALRLLGPALGRRGAELASEGLLPGALQVPPDGAPVLFLADAPITGGYPVVGVLDAGSLDRAAQLRPGEALRLV